MGKALLSTGFKLPEKKILLSVQEGLQDRMVHSMWALHELDYELFATEKTHAFLNSKGVPSTLVAFPDQHNSHPNALKLLREKEIELVVNLPTHDSKQLHNNFQIRRTSVDFGIPLLTNPQLVDLFVDSLSRHKR